MRRYVPVSLFYVWDIFWVLVWDIFWVLGNQRLAE
jgi:hypothetical protein